MLKKIFIAGFVLFMALGMTVLFNHGTQYVEFKRYQNEFRIRLVELEKIPQEQRTADIYMEMIDAYLILDYEQEKIISAYINASNAGSSRATYNLAILSGYGKDIGDHLPPYEELFKKAAQQGSLSATFTINARDIMDLEHMPFGYEHAAIQLIEAANQGHIEAAFAICSHGKEENNKNFLIGNMEYCEAPIKKAYPPALYFMGRMYEQNPTEFHPDTWAKNGLEKNIAKAKEFYQRAANQSYTPAIKRLDLLERNIPLSVTKTKERNAYFPDINPDRFE